MFDFFAKVLGFLESAFSFLINFIENLFLLLELLVSSIVFPLTLTGFLPNIFGTAVLVFLAIAVVKFILGR